MNLIITLDKNNIKINGGSYLRNSFRIIELKDVDIEKLKNLNYDYVYLFLFGNFEINKNLPNCQNNDYGIFCVSNKAFPSFFCLKRSFFEVFCIIIGNNIMTKTGETLEIKNHFRCREEDITYKITKFSDFVSMNVNNTDDYTPPILSTLNAERTSVQLLNKFSLLDFCSADIKESCFNFIMGELNDYQKKFLEENLYNKVSSVYFISKWCSDKILKYLKDNPYTVPEDYISKIEENFIYGDKSDLE